MKSNDKLMVRFNKINGLKLLARSLAFYNGKCGFSDGLKQDESINIHISLEI
jgi:hypothetical protein